MFIAAEKIPLRTEHPSRGRLSQLCIHQHREIFYMYPSDLV
jgi:hypothetical protein